MQLFMIYHFDVQLLGSCQTVQRTKLLRTFYHVPTYYSKAFRILLNKVASKFCFKSWQSIMNRITSEARILQWEGGFEDDVTFDHTLYTEADPKSFGGEDVILS